MLPASATPALRRSTRFRERLRSAVAGELNPVFVKEMRQAVRGWMVQTMFGMALFVMFGLAAWMLLTMDADRSGFGVKFFTTMLGALTVLTGICVSAWSGVRMMQERHADGGVDMLYFTPMSSKEIIQGKFLSNVTLAAVFFAAGAPFLAVAPLMRGVDVPTVVLVTGLMFSTVVMISQTVLVLASLPVNRMWKAVHGVVVAVLSAPFLVTWCRYCFELVVGLLHYRGGAPLELIAGGLAFCYFAHGALTVMAASYITSRSGLYLRRDHPPRVWTPPMRPEPPPPPLPPAERAGEQPR